MRKVLIINTVLFGYNGITNVILNYYENMKKDDLQIDFVTSNKVGVEIDKDIIKKIKNANLYRLSNRRSKLIKYLYQLSKIMKNDYDVVHVNGNSETMAFELCMAQYYKVPVRIAHCHSTSYKSRNFLYTPLKRLFRNSYTDKISCSKDAGEWIFGRDNFIVLNNAIDVNKYSYEILIREEYRRKLGISNKFVVGHIGLFDEGKNHDFILDIFKEIHLKKQNSMLLLISGSDTIPSKIQEKIKNLALNDCIQILLKRSDISNLLQAMDVFVFPSKWEGLGLSLIEAQASALPCIASTEVPIESKVTDYVKFLSLQDDSKVWAEKILEADVDVRKKRKNEVIEKIINAGYDIKKNSHILKEIYMKE